MSDRKKLELANDAEIHEIRIGLDTAIKEAEYRLKTLNNLKDKMRELGFYNEPRVV